MLLWFAAEPTRLPERVRDGILRADGRFVSVVSAWEYSAKRAKFPGRLELPFAALLNDNFRLLDLSFPLYHYAESLPAIHYDPFDRILIAQALSLELTLVTADKVIRRYPVPTFW